MKTPEFKKMIGDRKQNSDGFTYVYGCIKDGSSTRPATASTKKSIRADKRKVKRAELKRIKKDLA